MLNFDFTLSMMADIAEIMLAELEISITSK